MLGQYQEYADEVGAATTTETYVALKILIDNWRWAGVPFYIRTGKNWLPAPRKLPLRSKIVRMIFLLKMGLGGVMQEIPNRLIIRVQPHEGLRLLLTSKEPGPGGMRLFPSELNLSFGETFDERLPDAYERLLMDIARGNQTLFMRLDEVLAAWEFIDPIVAMAQKQTPLIYRAGGFGPEDTLFGNQTYGWLDPKEEEA